MTRIPGCRDAYEASKLSILLRCLQCTNSKYLDPVKASCKDICPDGYFPGGTGLRFAKGICHRLNACWSPRTGIFWAGISNRTCTPCAMDCAVCLSREECVTWLVLSRAQRRIFVSLESRLESPLESDLQVQCTNNKYLSPTGDLWWPIDSVMKKSATFPQLLSLKDLASPLAHQGTTIMVRMEVGLKKTDLPVVSCGPWCCGWYTGTCRSCPPTCQTCSDWNACDVCEPGRYGRWF